MKKQSLKILFGAMLHGKYELEDFLHGEVKSNYDQFPFKGRLVSRPNKKLKAYHAFLNTFLFEHLAINPRVAYAYRKGTNPHQSVAAHASSRAFLYCHRQGRPRRPPSDECPSFSRDSAKPRVTSAGVNITPTSQGRARGSSGLLYSRITPIWIVQLSR
jgi:hypothetical protein